MRFLLIGHNVCPVELTRGRSNLYLGLSGSGNLLDPQAQHTGKTLGTSVFTYGD